MFKKGLSDVVTSVLMILLSLAAVVIVWGFVANFIEDTTSTATEGLNFEPGVKVSNVVYDSASNSVVLSVEKKLGFEEVNKLRFIVKGADGSYSKDSDFTVGELGLQSYTLNLGESLFEPSSIEVYPIVVNEDGKEIVGKISVLSDIKFGAIVEDEEDSDEDVSTLAEGLVNHYEFENNGVDSVGGKALTVNGMITYEFGVVGQAAKFVEGSYFINNDLEISSDSVTISMWVKHSSLPSSPPPVSKAYQNYFVFGSNLGWSIFRNEYYNSNGVGFVKGDGPILVTNNLLDIDIWHNLVFVLDSDNNEIKIYIDGSDTLLTYNSADLTNIGEMRLGQSDESFKGLMDDVRIYNRVLTQTEITELYEMTTS
jgi:hypothetical protein